MKAKKTNKSDLENKRSIFFEVGLLVSLALAYIAFEVKFKPRSVSYPVVSEKVVVDQEMIPITRQEELVKSPPPPTITKTDILQIVDDDVELEEELEILDTEADENMEVDISKIQSVDVEEEVIEEEKIFIIVEQMPIFRPEICKTPEEGQQELIRYIIKNLRYPVKAQENGIEGKVYVQFVVNPQGQVEKVRVVRSVHPDLDEEAVRVVNSLPLFSPGKQRGKPVKVQYAVPIAFVLQ
ncbi:energy transducer TonB [Marinilabiliaceae bacterium JC017]|nr:energy transducer TonB [Marinilabiliaceae bacterium JC017]